MTRAQELKAEADMRAGEIERFAVWVGDQARDAPNPMIALREMESRVYAMLIEWERRLGRIA